MTATALTKVESKQLDALENTIETGLVTFYEVGSALKEIRDSKLYRGVFSTFEDYCRQRWLMQKTLAYGYIQACELRDNLSAIAETLPSNESQARPLTKLEPEQQREAWQQVLDRAHKTEDGHKLITAKIVSSVVSEMTGSSSKPVELWDLDTATEKLREKIEWCAERWPREMGKVLAAQLKYLAEEAEDLMENADDNRLFEDELKAEHEAADQLATADLSNEEIEHLAKLAEAIKADGDQYPDSCPICGQSDQVAILPLIKQSGKQYVKQCDRCEKIIRFVPKKETKQLLQEQEADHLLAAAN